MLKNYITMVVVFIASICLVGCVEKPVKYISSEVGDISSTAEEQKEDTSLSEEEFIDSYEQIPVYVCGAVKNPGVYYLEEGSLKEEALKMAGGLLDDAAEDYVNLAESVSSGEKIYFPYRNQITQDANMIPTDEGGESDHKININTATKDELMTLPGIGESKADAIINYRDENGPFQNIEEITNINGIKEGVYNNIRDYIIVS